MKIFIVLLIIMFVSCSSYQYSTWSEKDGFVMVQLDKVDSTIETYYAEITLESGRKIAVPLGKTDKENKFRIKKDFGKISDVQIYTNKDVQ